jgi:hypothetical protein
MKRRDFLKTVAVAPIVPKVQLEMKKPIKEEEVPPEPFPPEMQCGNYFNMCNNYLSPHDYANNCISPNFYPGARDEDD